MGTSDKAEGVEGGMIVGDNRQGRSNRKDRLALRETERQNDCRAEK